MSIGDSDFRPCVVRRSCVRFTSDVALISSPTFEIFVQRHYSLTCDRELAKRIETLAHEYDLTTEEVIQQLVTVGLEEIEAEQ